VSSRAAQGASLTPAPDASPLQAGDTSPRPGRPCAWCRLEIPATARVDARFCGKKCRQTAFRLRRRRTTDENAARPLRFAYADPPYPGLSSKYYRDESTYAGEVDHAALVASLTMSFDGWALSTSSRALRDILPMCPPGARVAAWVKPHGASPLTYGPHSCWEPVIVVPGRNLRPGVRDWLSALPARGGGTLPGRKPIAFCAWLFSLLGMQAGDELVDLFPGTGIVGRSWAELSRRTCATSGAGVGDASRPGSDDTSPTAAGDVSSAAAGDRP